MELERRRTAKGERDGFVGHSRAALVEWWGDRYGDDEFKLMRMIDDEYIYFIF